MADVANKNPADAASDAQCNGVANRFSYRSSKGKKGVVDYVARSDKECKAQALTQDLAVKDALYRLFLVMSSLSPCRFTHGDVQYFFKLEGILDEDIIDQVKTFLERPDLGANLIPAWKLGQTSINSRDEVGSSTLADEISAWGSESAEEVPF